MFSLPKVHVHKMIDRPMYTERSSVFNGKSVLIESDINQHEKISESVKFGTCS